MVVIRFLEEVIMIYRLVCRMVFFFLVFFGNFFSVFYILVFKKGKNYFDRYFVFCVIFNVFESVRNLDDKDMSV